MSKKAVTSNANVVEYNKDSLSLINELCSINESIVILKTDGQLTIQRSNNAKSIAYRLILPDTSFNIDGDSVGFYKFPEFYQLISCFNNPNILQATDNKLIIEKDKSKINYLLSDVETLSKGPKKINFGESDAKFVLNTAELKELKKMVGLLTAKNIRLDVSGNSIDVTLYNNNHDNSFNRVYDCESTETFEYSISSDILTIIPEGDYTIELVKSGIVRFTLIRENVSLEIFTASLNE